MIVKGKSRSGAAQLSEYLLRDEPGQSVRIVETAFGHEGDERAQRRAVFDSLMHFEEIAGFTDGEKGLYHAKLNPDALASQRMEDHHWSEAADITAGKLGKQHQPRVIVLHEKEDGRVHGHVVFMRAEQTEHGFRLIPDSHNYAKHEQAAREIEAVQHEIGHQSVIGQFTGRDRDPETGHFMEARPGYDHATQAYQPKSYDQATARLAEKTGVSPEQRQAEITALWRQSDSGQAFVSAAHNSGYDLARGDRKPIHMLVKDAEVYDLRRNLDGVKKAAIIERLADYPAEHLPFAAEVQRRQRERMDERQQEQSHERQDDRQGGRGDQAPDLKGPFDQARRDERQKPETADIAGSDEDRIRHDDTPEPEAARDLPAWITDEPGDKSGQDQDQDRERSLPAWLEAETFDRDAYHAQWEESIQQAGIDHAMNADQGSGEGSQGGETRRPGRPASHEEIDEWGNGLRAKTQSRQHDELIALSRDQGLENHRKEDELRQAYGEQREAWERQIAAIEARQERGGFWYWLHFRQRQEDSAALENLQKSVENGLVREEEALAIHRNAQARAREELEQRQAEEREADERTIAQAFDSGRIPETEAEPDNIIRVSQEPTPAEPASEDHTQDLPAWMDDNRMAEAWKKYSGESREAPQRGPEPGHTREGPTFGGPMG